MLLPQPRHQVRQFFADPGDLPGAVDDHAHLAVFELRVELTTIRVGDDVGDDAPVIHQQGTYAPDLDVFAPSINLNIIGSRTTPADADATAARLQDSRKLLETTIASVRDLITDLRPPALDDYGLLAGLRWIGAEVNRRTGLQVSVEGEEPSLRPRVKAQTSALLAASPMRRLVKLPGPVPATMRCSTSS